MAMGIKKKTRVENWSHCTTATTAPAVVNQPTNQGFALSENRYFIETSASLSSLKTF